MSILNVDKIQPIGGGSTITVDATDIQATSATITASKFVGSGDLSVTGVSTFTGNIDANGDLDVDGHTNLDHVSVSGATTCTGGAVFLNSISLNASTNNYLYFDDNLNFTRNGHGLEMIIDTNGKVGINTTTPDTQLEVFGGSTSIQVGNQSGTGRFGADGTSTKIGSHSNHHLDLFTNGAANTRLRITSSGNVGIGTVNPTSLLTVGARPKTTTAAATVLISPASGNASIQLRGGSPTLEFDGTGGGNGQIFTDNADLAISNGTLDGAGTELVRIDSSGNISINNAATPPSSNGQIGKRLGIKSDQNNIIVGETTNSGNSGLILESRVTGRSGNARSSQIDLGNGIMKFYTAASGADVTERLRIDSDGRTLINNRGNATPGLSVNADDLVIGYGTQSDETGITMFSTTNSGIRFNDNSGTDGAIEYAHAARELRFNAAGANRLIFGINASNTPVFNLGVSSGDYNNHDKGDRTSVKVGDYLYIESARGAGHNTRAGLGYNCYFHSLDSFYCGTNSPSSGDNRPAAYGMAYGNHYFYNDASNTAHSPQATLTMTKNMVIHRQGYVTKPNQPSCTLYEPRAIQINTSGDNVPIGYHHVEHNSGMTVSNGGSSDSTRQNSRIQVPIAGRYLISSQMSGSLNSAASVDANDGVIWYLRKNGGNNTTYDGMWAWDTLGSTTGQEFDLSFCIVLSLATNDYLEVAYTNIHTNFNVDLNKGYFSVHMLS